MNKGDNVIVVEDVNNNFKTTKKVIDLVESHGAKVIAITSLLNRSMDIDHEYTYEHRTIPIISLVRYPCKEYKQDDPEIALDMRQGNFILKPKDEWDFLSKVMELGELTIACQ